MKGNIVAYGTVVDVSGPVHCVPLGLGNVRVVVNGIVDGEAMLPIPVKGEFETVSSAIGHHVAWPIHLIDLMDHEVITDLGQTLVTCIHNEFWGIFIYVGN